MKAGRNHGLTVFEEPERHLALAPQLLWSHFSSGIQLSFLQSNNPLKEDFTKAQHLHNV